ncbi:proton-conducting transporter transmembrane domain-containing protein [Congregibacter sp.]|uniref:proton-conducting transporter transmembrane domain-containing protein n=1 Tax=Congregibacter sp. TaxID=2744308 RepID=UPI003F6BE99C
MNPSLATPLAAPLPMLLAAMFVGVPITWLLTALFCQKGSDYRQARARSLSLAGGIAAMIFSLGAILLLSLYGPTTVYAPGILGDVFSVRIDAVSVAMTTLVSFVGLVVLRFSHSYLMGDARQADFLRYLMQTLAAVSVVVMAGNVVLLVAGWVFMSLSLHRLLVFYPDRPRAQLAARKKFIIARGSDLALALAVGLMVAATGSTDITAIASAAQNSADTFSAAPALLLVLAALLKSAQFPTHGWIAEVMEAPTPVSALLHAGIVNAGGFLIIRFADVIASSGVALYALLLVGGVTALFGSLVMMTQRSVKGALAYSTVAQMGFMLLQCGLGAFSSAMLHIIAHSLYKAHAFLSSGSVVDIARGNGFPAKAAPVRPALILLSLFIAGGIFAVWSSVVGITIATKPAIVGLGAILVFGAMHLVIQSSRGQGSALVLFRASSTAAVVAGLYFTLQTLALLVFEGSVPEAGKLDALQFALMMLMLGTFGAVTVLQWYLPSARSNARWQAFWVHLSNGFYVNQLFNQFIALPRVNGEANR